MLSSFAIIGIISHPCPSRNGLLSGHDGGPSEQKAHPFFRDALSDDFSCPSLTTQVTRFRLSTFSDRSSLMSTLLLGVTCTAQWRPSPFASGPSIGEIPPM